MKRVELRCCCAYYPSCYCAQTAKELRKQKTEIRAWMSIAIFLFCMLMIVIALLGCDPYAAPERPLPSETPFVRITPVSE